LASDGIAGAVCRSWVQAVAIRVLPLAAREEAFVEEAGSVHTELNGAAKSTRQRACGEERNLGFR